MICEEDHWSLVEVLGPKFVRKKIMNKLYKIKKNTKVRLIDQKPDVL